MLSSFFNSVLHPICVLFSKTAEACGPACYACMPCAEVFAKCFSGMKCLQIHYDKERADVIREV